MQTAKFSKYTRDENKTFKWTEEQIQEIKDLLEEGFNVNQVSKETGIPYSTVRYYSLDDNKRLEFNKNKMKYNKELSKEQIKKYNDNKADRKGKKLKDKQITTVPSYF